MKGFTELQKAFGYTQSEVLLSLQILYQGCIS